LTKLESAKRVCIDELSPGDYAAFPWGTYEYIFVIRGIHHFAEVAGEHSEAHTLRELEVIVRETGAFFFRTD
jgi:hypothetical protein